MTLTSSVSQDGNLYPRAFNCIQSLPEVALHHSDHNLRHPSAIYSLSLGRVTQAFQEVLNENDKIYQVSSAADGTCTFDTFALLKAQQELLDALMAHIDDGYQILKALHPASKATKPVPFADKWLESAKHPTVQRLKHQMKPYRDTFAPIVNKIKHEHGRLRAIVMRDRQHLQDQYRRIAGYFVEGVDKSGTVGPDVSIHRGKYALSFHRDLRYHFVHLYAIDNFLANAIIDAINREYSIQFSPAPCVHAPSLEMREIAERISHLPFLFFFDEVGKPTPSVTFSEHDQDALLTLTGTSPLKASSFFTWEVQLQFNGDGITQSWKLPYMGL